MHGQTWATPKKYGLTVSADSISLWIILGATWLVNPKKQIDTIFVQSPKKSNLYINFVGKNIPFLVRGVASKSPSVDQPTTSLSFDWVRFVLTRPDRASQDTPAHTPLPRPSKKKFSLKTRRIPCSLEIKHCSKHSPSLKKNQRPNPNTNTKFPTEFPHQNLHHWTPPLLHWTVSLWLNQLPRPRSHCGPLVTKKVDLVDFTVVDVIFKKILSPILG